jgi:hypothetical protein
LTICRPKVAVPEVGLHGEAITREVSYWDWDGDALESFDYLMDMAELHGAVALCDLFHGDMRSCQRATTDDCPMGVVEKDREGYAGQYAASFANRAFVTRGALSLSAQNEWIDECESCGTFHGFRLDRRFVLGPPVLFFSASSCEDEVWLPLSFDADVEDAAPVRYHLVSYVVKVLPRHYVCVARPPGGGPSWRRYDDAVVHVDYRPAVEDGFVRDRIRLAFYARE